VLLNCTRIVTRRRYAVGMQRKALRMSFAQDGSGTSLEVVFPRCCDPVAEIVAELRAMQLTPRIEYVACTPQRWVAHISVAESGGSPLSHGRAREVLCALARRDVCTGACISANARAA
jgi:hypothetical protein